MARDDRERGAAVLDDETIVEGLQQRVDGDRDGAGLDRAEKADREVHAVGEAEHDALAAADAACREQVGEAMEMIGAAD